MDLQAWYKAEELELPEELSKEWGECITVLRNAGISINDEEDEMSWGGTLRKGPQVIRLSRNGSFQIKSKFLVGWLYIIES